MYMGSTNLEEIFVKNVADVYKIPVFKTNNKETGEKYSVVKVIDFPESGYITTTSKDVFINDNEVSQKISRFMIKR